MKTIIASVYCNSEFNPVWSKLQKQFVEKNTKDFHLTAFLNREKPENIEPGFEIIGSRNDSPPKDFIDLSIDHSKSLNLILSYFRSKSNEYDNFLILDSDCFPIQKNWLTTLKNNMISKKRSCAAVVRTENLSSFPHPCAMLLTKEMIFEDWLSFDVRNTKNIFQEDVVDVCCGLPLEKFYPLLRTNVWNPHPLFYGIYNKMFYHHGCGSRTPHYRADWYYSSSANNHNLWDSFFASPDKFIHKLLGNQQLML